MSAPQNRNGAPLDLSAVPPQTAWMISQMAAWAEANGFGPYYEMPPDADAATAGLWARRWGQLADEWSTTHGGMTVQQSVALSALVSAGDLTPDGHGAYVASRALAADIAAGRPNGMYTQLAPSVTVLAPAGMSLSPVLPAPPVRVDTARPAGTTTAAPVATPPNVGGAVLGAVVGAVVPPVVAAASAASALAAAAVGGAGSTVALVPGGAANVDVQTMGGPVLTISSGPDLAPLLVLAGVVLVLGVS